MRRWQCIFPAVERFWSKVEQGPECWLWKAKPDTGGYGSFFFRGRKHRAHRVSWILEYGEIPAGLSVLHRCDTPACVRPSHLFLGTQADNIRDAANKGRLNVEGLSQGRKPLVGEKNGRAKLSPENVEEIRLRARVLSQSELAAQYGVNQSTISRLLSGRSWT